MREEDDLTWAPDPTGRYPLRARDGGGWTEMVRYDRSGVVRIDRDWPPEPAGEPAPAGGVQYVVIERPPNPTVKWIGVVLTLVALPFTALFSWFAADWFSNGGMSDDPDGFGLVVLSLLATWVPLLVGLAMWLPNQKGRSRRRV